MEEVEPPAGGGSCVEKAHLIHDLASLSTAMSLPSPYIGNNESLLPPGVIPNLRGDIYLIAVGASIIGVPFLGLFVGIPLALAGSVRIIQHSLFLPAPPKSISRALSFSVIVLGALVLVSAAGIMALQATQLALRVQRYLYEHGPSPLAVLTWSALLMLTMPMLAGAIGSASVLLGLWLRQRLPRVLLLRLWLLLFAPVPLAVIFIVLYAIARLPLGT